MELGMWNESILVQAADFKISEGHLGTGPFTVSPIQNCL